MAQDGHRVLSLDSLPDKRIGDVGDAVVEPGVAHGKAGQQVDVLSEQLLAAFEERPLLEPQLPLVDVCLLTEEAVVEVRHPLDLGPDVPQELLLERLVLRRVRRDRVEDAGTAPEADQAVADCVHELADRVGVVP